MLTCGAPALSSRPLTPCVAPLCLFLQLPQVCTWAGVPTDGYLLRPLSKSGAAFLSSPLATDEICKRLQHHLRRLGLYEGETTHSLRRGTVIHDHQELGKTAAECGARLQHKQPGGPQTLQYLDTSRETGGPPHQRRRLNSS